MKKKPKKEDAQVKEFLRKDLGNDIKKSGSLVIIKPKMRPTSILLHSSIIEKLKKKAHTRGIGYQTMLKIIVHEHVDDY